MDGRLRHARATVGLRHGFVTRDLFAKRPRDHAFLRLGRDGHPLTQLRTVHEWGLSGVDNCGNQQRECRNSKKRSQPIRRGLFREPRESFPRHSGSHFVTQQNHAALAWHV